jgi:hypothetical protein
MIHEVDYSQFTAKDVCNRYFGCTAYPAPLFDLFHIKLTTISHEAEGEQSAKHKIKELRALGYTVKSKKYSDFTAFIAVKPKNEIGHD